MVCFEVHAGSVPVLLMDSRKNYASAARPRSPMMGLNYNNTHAQELSLAALASSDKKARSLQDQRWIQSLYDTNISTYEMESQIYTF